MKEITKHYTNGEVTVVWKNTLCTHSTHCFRELPKVFHPLRLPWVTPESGATEEIITQVKQCPSGALTYYMNNEKPE